METTRHSISLNAQPKTQAEALADLLVTAAQAQQMLGGTDVNVSAGPGGGGHVKVFNGATRVSGAPSGGGAGYSSNYNETAAYDETDLDELEDLLLTDAQESDIKCGGGDYQAVVFVGGWGASLHSNHNETVAEDEATTPEALIDLPLEDAEQIKGGSTDGPQGTGKTLTAVLLGK